MSLQKVYPRILISDFHTQMPYLLVGVDAYFFSCVFVVVKLSLQLSLEAHRVMRRRGSHVFLDNRLTDVGEVSPF
jgi:hypothetical protein